LVTSKAEKFSLKDHLFNKQKLIKLADEIYAVYPEFRSSDFVSTSLSAFPRTGIKAKNILD
jgi:hypothetical protein